MVVIELELLENGKSELQEIITGSIGGTFRLYPVNLNLLAFATEEAKMSFAKFWPPLSLDSNYSKMVCQGCRRLSPAALGALFVYILLILTCSHLLPRKLR